MKFNIQLATPLFVLLPHMRGMWIVSGRVLAPLRTSDFYLKAEQNLQPRTYLKKKKKEKHE